MGFSLGLLSSGQPAASIKDSKDFGNISASKGQEWAEAAQQEFCSFNKFLQHWFWKWKPSYLQN